MRKMPPCWCGEWRWVSAGPTVRSRRVPTARRTLVDIDQPGVAPDGLTVDDEGGIWIALWNGAAIHRYAPDGSLLASVQLPVERPTSCAFGGPRRDTLFVTTARTDLDDDALARQPHAGKVFAIDGLGTRGLPCLPYRGLGLQRA